MKCDIVIAGVGGQGVLSISAIIASALLRQGWQAKQSEVHGMSQRGGAVEAHLRLSDEPIYSDLIAQANADLIVAMEPVESLRYVGFLSPEGTLLASADPFLNIPNYPDLEEILAAIRAIPNARIVEAEKLAREAGSAKAANMVMVGATSWRLPVEPEPLETEIEAAFRAKGSRIVEINIEAFRLGREATKPFAA